MAKKRDPLFEIAKDVLKAAVDLEVFNIQQLANQSGHPWATVKRILSLYLLKDSHHFSFMKSEVPKHYKIVPFIEDRKHSVEKTIKNKITKTAYP
jgi:hypothetical protein